MKLHIFELGSCVHVGKVNKSAVLCAPVERINGKWHANDMPMGCVSSVLSQIHAYGYDGDLVFAADRNPFIKKEMYPQYKANRKHDAYVESQKELVEIILQDCDATVLWRDGYEADDIIYTLYRNYHDKYDEIVIHTDDSDMYFMVDDKTSIARVRSDGKDVDMENYSIACSSKHITRYNTVFLNKVMKGDSSDNIPAAPKIVRSNMMQLFDREAFYPLMGDIPRMRGLIKMACPEALFNFDLVAPLIVPDCVIPEHPSIDMDRVAEWGCLIGNARFRLPHGPSKHVTDLAKTFFDR